MLRQTWGRGRQPPGVGRPQEHLYPQAAQVETGSMHMFLMRTLLGRALWLLELVLVAILHSVLSIVSLVLEARGAAPWVLLLVVSSQSRPKRQQCCCCCCQTRLWS